MNDSRNVIAPPDGAPVADVLEFPRPKASADPMARCIAAYHAARTRRQLEILATALRDDPYACVGGRPTRRPKPRIWRRTT